MKGDAGAHSAIEVLTCRNNLNRKRIVSLQLTADSSQLVAFIFLPSPLITVIDPSHSFRMTFYRPLSLRTGQKKNLHSILLRRSHKPVSSVRLRRPPPYKQGGLPNPYSFHQNPFPQHCSKSFVGALNDALPYPVIQSGSKNAV